MESSESYVERPVVEPYTPSSPVQQRPPWYKRAGGAIAAVGLLIAKFAAKLKLLLVLLPKIKLFTTAGSMLVSVAAYSLIWGWKFAAGFVVLLLVHEMGHVVQLRREGVPASAPLFIPFMGAVVGMKKLPDDAAAEARVGLAGPVLGSLGALGAAGIWLATGSDLFRALAFIAFFLNLFNLLPVLPLDGGRAMSALTPWMWLVGYAALIAVAIVFPNPIVLIILLFGGMELYRRWKTRKSPEAQSYYKVAPASRIAIAAVYIGLAVALAYGMHVTHLPRTLHDV
jgi:Zn-dependent protease